MKANLCFSLELPYLQTEYSQLKKLAICVNNIGHSKFEWVFRGEDRERVTAILGKPIDFGDLERIEVESKARKKGEGYFKILARTPKYFVCETIINAKAVKKMIPIENVAVAWKVMLSYPIGKAIKSRTIAKNIIENLGITRFNRESNSFDFQKFFGARKDYYNYFYSPIKILEAVGGVKHHKEGKVERIANKWTYQRGLE